MLSSPVGGQIGLGDLARPWRIIKPDLQTFQIAILLHWRLDAEREGPLGIGGLGRHVRSHDQRQQHPAIYAGAFPGGNTLTLVHAM